MIYTASFNGSYSMTFQIPVGTSVWCVLLIRFLFVCVLADTYEVTDFCASYNTAKLFDKWWMHPARPVKTCEALVIDAVLKTRHLYPTHVTFFMDRLFNTIRLFA